MVLSIIGNILGDGDGNSGTRSSSGNDSDDILGGDLAGSMSDDELLPGARAESATGGNGGDGTGDEALFDDGDLGGGDDFLDDDSMSIDGMGEMSDMDEMGGMGEMSDMGSMDGMDAMDDGGTVSSEVEARVEEMENSVGSLSSTVNTVQSENEKIGESLDDIEENIRKLLEVYEMVTQGVNPFVEGDSLADSMGAGAAGSGDFGGQSLFDSGDGGEADETIDEDIANAEADDFLDESIIDDDDGFDDDFDDLEDETSMDGDDNLDPDADADAAGDDELSFDELKSEYESGDANWDSDESAADDGDTTDDEDDLAADDDDGFDDDLAVDGDEADETDSLIDDADAIASDETSDTDGDTADLAAHDRSHPVWDDGGRPYLETIPSEYDTEFVVMDWLEYLVDELGLNGAARTLRFYESVYWVSTSVESHLQTVLNGFGGGPDIGEPEPHSSLGVDHKRSLWWISQIATPEKKRRPFDVWVDEENITVEQAMAVAEQHQPEVGAEDGGDSHGHGHDHDHDHGENKVEHNDADPAAGTDHTTAVDEFEPVAATTTTTTTTTTDAIDTADTATGEELTFDETTVADDHAELESPTETAAGDNSHIDQNLDPDPDPDPDYDLDPDSDPDPDTNSSEDDIELEFATDEPLDPFAAEDDSTDQTEGDGEADGRPASGADTDGEVATTTPAADTELESSGAQKIFIEEAEEDTVEQNHRNEPAGERVEPEAEVTDGGQMIWVDSDVVLSESGARLCNTRATTGGVDRGEQAEIAKPLVVSDEPADLDGWQVERIKLLLAPEEFEGGCEQPTDEAAHDHEQ
ncbi:fla cluster protein FlaCE [Natrialba magadii ATCC 43099]|uniref:Fla cluster protein FlaCE n=1 Tax=Natrialba magadii (strain ATCC 43099 / DSM 3394 / CCM 3739 / CIP 104546 / IAM 13178 / JCM 8861 / NBRC 102185 / NCIMB 2190 / MS3) TaxID=547559 RepID=D3T0E6_NATMM|nr:FlaD/FlaE family flagellar protein [Natrialba magadii]ADD06425.1 fla cluster protein FlaCE [Natrialba magadii ATCC 43099]ELY31688.1 Flagella accessory C family protein [Natrialba magadii ATCC 43099]